MHLSSLQAFQDYLVTLAPKQCHHDRLMKLWLEGKSLHTPPSRPGHHLPAALIKELHTIEGLLAGLANIVSSHDGADSSKRLLCRLHDGQTIETVLLPKNGLCISSQVGCAVGCVFCMTGRSGLLRQLGSMEMLAQVSLARQQRSVQKVVFMGMGEPAHNLENVIDTIQILGRLGGIAHKNLVFSTVGDLRVFERLSQLQVKPALALSLHTTSTDLRKRLLPNAPNLSPGQLVDLAEIYARRTGYPIQYQWTLIEGVNDGQDEIEGITRLLTNKYAMMNLIPFNSIDGVQFQRPSSEKATDMARQLRKNGVLTKLRQSAGQDVDAGCGQLRARTIPVALHKQASLATVNGNRPTT
jgi:23S rRNA (adenine2503-C2)-methyltransferase